MPAVHPGTRGNFQTRLLPNVRQPREPRIQVIDRAAGLLDAIARYRRPVSLKILIAETGLHASTAHRILRSLIQNGLVEKNSDNHYRLGLRLVQLGTRLHSTLDLRAIALPIMEQLRDEFHETVNLSIREGDQVVYIERVTPNRMMHVRDTVIGTDVPDDYEHDMTMVYALMAATEKPLYHWLCNY